MQGLHKAPWQIKRSIASSAASRLAPSALSRTKCPSPRTKTSRASAASYAKRRYGPTWVYDVKSDSCLADRLRVAQRVQVLRAQAGLALLVSLRVALFRQKQDLLENLTKEHDGLIKDIDRIKSGLELEKESKYKTINEHESQIKVVEQTSKASCFFASG